MLRNRIPCRQSDNNIFWAERRSFYCYRTSRSDLCQVQSQKTKVIYELGESVAKVVKKDLDYLRYHKVGT